MSNNVAVDNAMFYLFDNACAEFDEIMNKYDLTQVEMFHLVSNWFGDAALDGYQKWIGESESHLIIGRSYD